MSDIPDADRDAVVKAVARAMDMPVCLTAREAAYAAIAALLERGWMPTGSELEAAAWKRGYSTAISAAEDVAFHYRVEHRDTPETIAFNISAEIRTLSFDVADSRFKALRNAYDAYRFYVDASDSELSERGITRDDALRTARDAEIALHKLELAIAAPSPPGDEK